MSNFKFKPGDDAFYYSSSDGVKHLKVISIEIINGIINYNCVEWIKSRELKKKTEYCALESPFREDWLHPTPQDALRAEIAELNSKIFLYDKNGYESLTRLDNLFSSVAGGQDDPNLALIVEKRDSIEVELNARSYYPSRNHDKPYKYVPLEKPDEESIEAIEFTGRNIVDCGEFCGDVFIRHDLQSNQLHIRCDSEVCIIPPGCFIIRVKKDEPLVWMSRTYFLSVYVGKEGAV